MNKDLEKNEEEVSIVETSSSNDEADLTKVSTSGKGAAAKAKMAGAQEKFQNVMNKFGAFLGKNIRLSALRDSFGIILPLIILGSFALILNQVFLSSGGLIAQRANAQKNPFFVAMQKYVIPFLDAITNNTMHANALFFVFLAPYFLAKSYKCDALLPSLVTVAIWLTYQPFFVKSGIVLNNATLNSAVTQLTGQTLNLSDAELGTIFQGQVNTYIGGGLNREGLQGQGILLAMIVGLTIPGIYNYFAKIEKLKIRMPAGVPSAVARGFDGLVAVTITICLTVWVAPLYNFLVAERGYVGRDLINKFGTNTLRFANNAPVSGIRTRGVIFGEGRNQRAYAVVLKMVRPTAGAAAVPEIKVQYHNFTDIHVPFAAINQFIGMPFRLIGQNPGTIFFLIMMISLLFFFGVHGPNVLTGAFESLWSANTTKNTLLFRSGLDHTNPVNMDATGLDDNKYAPWTMSSQDLWAKYGGTGSTLPLIIVMMVFIKARTSRMFAKAALAPGIFQINEPVIFGFPVMLNFIYFIPFVFAPPLISIVGYGLTLAGAAAAPVSGIPWTTPMFANAAIITADWKATVWQILFFIGMIFLYLPFAVMAVKKELRESGENPDPKFSDAALVKPSDWKIFFAEMKENRINKKAKKEKLKAEGKEKDKKQNIVDEQKQNVDKTLSFDDFDKMSFEELSVYATSIGVKVTANDNKTTLVAKLSAKNKNQ